MHSSKPLIFLLTIQYFPDFGGAAIRTRNVARILAKCGFKVVVLTSQPQYLYGRPISRKYQGKIIVRENEDNLVIYRFKLPPVPHSDISNRLIRYISYVLLSFLLIPYLWKKEGKPDIVYAHFPPIFSYLVGYTVSLITKSILIYDIHDLLPEQIETIMQKPNRLVIAFLRAMAVYLYRKPKIITGCSQTMLKYLKKQYKITQPTICIPTGIEEINVYINKEKARKILINMGIYPKELEDKTIFLYAGVMDPPQDLETIVKAFMKINQPDIVLVMFGEGKCKNKLIELSKNKANIYIYNSVPRKILDIIITSADIGIVPLKATKTLRFSIPTKLFDYISKNKIVLCATNSLELASILKEYKIGILVNNSVDNVYEAILELYRLIKKRKQLQTTIDEINRYKKNIDLNSLSLKLCSCLSRMLRNISCS